MSEVTDADMLDWLADNQIIEGFAGSDSDIYAEACHFAYLAGAADVSNEHYRLALREMIKREMEGEK